MEGTFANGSVSIDSMPNDCYSYFFCDAFLSISENSWTVYTREFGDECFIETSACDIFEDQITLYHDELPDVEQESVEYWIEDGYLILIFTRTGNHIIEYLCKLSEYDGTLPPSGWIFDWAQIAALTKASSWLAWKGVQSEYVVVVHSYRTRWVCFRKQLKLMALCFS